MNITEKTPVGKVCCCPTLHPCESCDELDIRYRLPFRPVVQTRDGEQEVLVEVTLCFRLECCTGPLSLGDLLYSTTLLPGEKVRNYAGLDLGFLDIGGYVAASSYDASAASAFARNLSQHAQSSSRQVEVSVRAATSTSVSEVASRSHAAGESQDKYESASREFSNPNRCHALTYLFYRIEKCQTLRFTLVAIDRWVDDPACPVGIRPLSAEGAAPEAATSGNGATGEPIPAAVRAAALGQVEADLRAQGLLDAAGNCTAETIERLRWERTVRLPTPGVMVKCCLDDCDACEPARKREIELELAAKELDNRMELRKIELLDQSQEYRCCPGGRCCDHDEGDGDEPEAG
jgi:hypothetical protein